MSEPRRGKPYVYVTWLSALLAGSDRCWWRTWYQAIHKYAKLPEDPERAAFLAEWTKTHDAMTETRAAGLRAEGWAIKVEDEAAFKIRGAGGDLAGKPDIVAMKGNDVLVIDCKSGRRRLSDHEQVRIYIFALRLLGRGAVRGEVQYRDGREAVSYETADGERVAAAMRAVTNPEQTFKPAPSAYECGRCQIAACTARHRAAEVDSGGAF
jgi:hypothetical protein